LEAHSLLQTHCRSICEYSGPSVPIKLRGGSLAKDVVKKLVEKLFSELRVAAYPGDAAPLCCFEYACEVGDRGGDARV
jgi:hypothetical protein